MPIPRGLADSVIKNRIRTNILNKFPEETQKTFREFQKISTPHEINTKGWFTNFIINSFLLYYAVTMFFSKQILIPWTKRKEELLDYIVQHRTEQNKLFNEYLNKSEIKSVLNAFKSNNVEL